MNNFTADDLNIIGKEPWSFTINSAYLCYSRLSFFMKLINPLVILRILSTILLLEAISFLFCLPVSYIYKEPANPFILSSLITIFTSLFFYLESRKVTMNKVTNREGFLSVALGWFFFTAFGTLPYILSGSIPSFVDAFFESTSGFTTTGSSILTDVEILPRSILFWRSFTHWIGGLGIVVLVIIILPTLRISAHQFLSLESSLKEKTHPKTKAVGIRLLYIYLGLTLAEIILLLIGDVELFDSLCLTFGTVATGGFATRNTSITDYSPYTQYVIALFMFLSGVSFVIYYYIVKFNFKKVRTNEELWFYLATTLFAGAVATVILMAGTTKSFEPAFREGFFQVISIITTTGFATTDYLLWPQAGLFLLFILLFSGASTGSSTGSIKMLRHLIVIKNIRSAFVRLIHPNVVNQIKVFGKPVSEDANISILSFIVLYFFIFLIGSIIVVASGVEIVTGTSAVATSLGNIGPGLGTIGPMHNYSQFSDFNKIVFSILMLTGRLELFTIFILFSRSFWKL